MNEPVLPKRKHGRGVMPVLIAVGDVHGDLDALRDVLRAAGFVNRSDRWSGGRSTIVQLGDVLDGGADPRKAWLWLADLQRRAARAGGRLVRLLGNHELMVLTGANGRYGEAFRASLRNDVLTGKVRAAHAASGWLFTHAGVTRDLRRRLLPYAPRQGAEATRLAAALNRILRGSASLGRFRHSCFRAGYARGGGHRHPGSYWADARDLFISLRGGEVPQVVGHSWCPVTPPEGVRVVFADVGLSKGSRGFVRLDDAGAELVYLRQPQVQRGDERDDR